MLVVNLNCRMTNNYYTLKALVDEISEGVVASVIGACYTRVEHTLEVVLNKSGERPEEIVISCKPQANYMFMRSAPRRHTGANVLQDVIGCAVLSIEVIANERTVVLKLSTEKSLVINLFGQHANIYLVDAEREVIEAFLRKKKTAGIPFVPNNGTSQEGSVEQFREVFNAVSGSPLQRLSAAIPSFSGPLGKEVFFRTGGDELARVAGNRTAALDSGVIPALYGVISQLRAELARPGPRIYYDGDVPVTMSLIEMRHLVSLREEMYASVNSCVVAYCLNAERRKSDAQLKKSVLDRLARRKDELEKTIGKIDDDISGNREMKYRKYGDIIMAHLGEIEKGAGTLSGKDIDDEVRLDPRLTAVQNAQVYFEKAKDARESRRQAVARREELTRSLEKIEMELRSIEAGADQDRLASIAKTEKAKEQAQTPFREFEANGYKVYVGKDARNNDQLTFGFAKPNDVFLHARGVSGSHVIIRNSSREYPQKEVLEFAARIAAHYSKARTSGIVPVTYTMRKFVKKAKGEPGAVIVDREEVIFVRPGIPQPRR